MKILVVSLLLICSGSRMLAEKDYKPMSSKYKKLISELDHAEKKGSWYHQSMSEVKDVFKRFEAHVESEGAKPLGENGKKILKECEKEVMKAYEASGEKVKTIVSILWEGIRHKLESGYRFNFTKKCLENMHNLGQFLAFMYHKSSKEVREKSGIECITLSIKSEKEEDFWERFFMIQGASFYKTQDHMAFGHHKKHTHRGMHHGKGRYKHDRYTKKNDYKERNKMYYDRNENK